MNFDEDDDDEEDDKDDEADENTSNTTSIDKSEHSLQVVSQNSSEKREIISQPLRKVNCYVLVSSSFYEFLQVKEDEIYQIEMRRKVVEEYVQHVYEIKLEHQLELDKGYAIN